MGNERAEIMSNILFPFTLFLPYSEQHADRWMTKYNSFSYNDMLHFDTTLPDTGGTVEARTLLPHIIIPVNIQYQLLQFS